MFHASWPVAILIVIALMMNEEQWYWLFRAAWFVLRWVVAPIACVAALIFSNNLILMVLALAGLMWFAISAVKSEERSKAEAKAVEDAKAAERARIAALPPKPLDPWERGERALAELRAAKAAGLDTWNHR